ncbi:zinc finger, CCHC-type containing protein [Tanacetum coccineum]|uniref:Zinc finger, CCHC-type containing protein n=1 Tax=Tanacetum coccineum TaxID=301880 RepID=A0ABQ5FA56_9ASTR
MAGNTVKEMTTNFGKLDKFEGHDFRRWQKKMHFLLTTLKVVYVLTTLMPKLLEDDTMEAIRRRAKWENDDYICKGHIWNGMSDPLFNVESDKELSDSTESKYMAEDASSKKFLVSNFNNYKMVDSRPVMEQFNELLRILGQYTQHGLKMDESIYVSSVIDKLPPSWKDFKYTLKHGKDDLSLIQLGNHLRIEESLRAQESDKGKGKEVVRPSVNMIEEGKNKNNKQNKGKKRGFNENNTSSGTNKKPKLQCWKCGKTGHFKRDCRSVNKKNENAGGSGKGSKNQSQDQGQNLVNVWNILVKYSVSLISKALYVQVDAIAWWIDSDATSHVCKDRCWFKTYELVEDGSVLYMVMIISLLFMEKEVYESNKYILLKSGVFVGFGYYNNGMFMLNLNKVPDDSGSVYMSSSTVVNSSLWHARIIHETIAPYTPQQNGVAERKNKALKEMVNSMLSYSGLSEGFWREAIIKRCNIDEKRFSSIPRPKDIIPNLDEFQRDDHLDVTSKIPEPRRGKRARKAKSYGSDFQLYLVEGSRDQIGSQYSYYYSIKDDPRTYNEAMQSRYATF